MHEIPLFGPADQIIAIKSRPPCIYLVNAEADKVKRLVFKFNPIHALFPLCIKYAAFQKYNKQSKMSILYKPSGKKIEYLKPNPPITTITQA
jgi:hypothetical protein